MIENLSKCRFGHNSVKAGYDFGGEDAVQYWKQRNLRGDYAPFGGECYEDLQHRLGLGRFIDRGSGLLSMLS